MFHAIYIGSTSACFELENTAPFYAPEPYTVALNGRQVISDQKNVFSLYELQPGKRYDVTLRQGDRAQTLRIQTTGETCAIDVRAFGAKGDGLSDDTRAIQRAILSLPAGGRLFFPAGRYLTGPLFLKSHMTLELSEGAVLLGSTNQSDYPVLPAAAEDLNGGSRIHIGSFEGLPRDMYASILTGEYVEDVAIIGPGTIDGRGEAGGWWESFPSDPVARPRLLFLNRSSNVTVHGISACNSASWQLHPNYSDDIAFYDVSVLAPKDSPNTDALDPESCDGVQIVGCQFSVGDDCIAIKSGKLEMARECARPASGHTIRNCKMAFGHGAITLGSEISGGVQSLSVSQCLFEKTDRGLRIKTRRGRGDTCFIDDIAFDNIRMEGVVTPIVMNMWYHCVDPDGDSEYVQGRAPIPVDERTPRLGRFSFTNMNCTDAEAAACYCDGLPEQPIDQVTFENVFIAFAKDARPGVPSMFTNAPERCRLGLYFENVKKVALRNVCLEGHAGEAVITHNVGEIAEEGFEAKPHV